jgi:hypothetical protein
MLGERRHNGCRLGRCRRHRCRLGRRHGNGSGTADDDRPRTPAPGRARRLRPLSIQDWRPLLIDRRKRDPRWRCRQRSPGPLPAFNTPPRRSWPTATAAQSFAARAGPQRCAARAGSPRRGYVERRPALLAEHDLGTRNVGTPHRRHRRTDGRTRLDGRARTAKMSHTAITNRSAARPAWGKGCDPGSGSPSVKGSSARSRKRSGNCRATAAASAAATSNVPSYPSRVAATARAGSWAAVASAWVIRA